MTERRWAPIASDRVTPPEVFFERRKFLSTVALGMLGAAPLFAGGRSPEGKQGILDVPLERPDVFPSTRNKSFSLPKEVDQRLTPRKAAARRFPTGWTPKRDSSLPSSTGMESTSLSYIPMPTDTNFPDILSVPLLVKPPLGRFAPGVRDHQLETIDILPTLAQYVGVRLPVEIDGVSALDPENPGRTDKTIFFAGALRRGSYPSQRVMEGIRQAVARKHQLFGSRDQNPLTTSADGFRMAGRRPDEIGVGERSPDTAWLDLPALYDGVDPTSDFVPAQITGYLQSHQPGRPAAALALAINGIVRATTRVEFQPSESTSPWSVIVSEDSFRSGRNLIEIFTIESIRGTPSLRLAYRSKGSPSLPNFGVKTIGSIWGLEDSGFYNQERWAGKLVRWTDGKASVTVSRERLGFTPAFVEIGLLKAGPRGSKLTVLSCGEPIFEGRVGPGAWQMSLKLQHCSPQAEEVGICILSDTFNPSEVSPNSTDTRQLGVAVESIVFLPDQGGNER